MSQLDQFIFIFNKDDIPNHIQKMEDILLSCSKEELEEILNYKNRLDQNLLYDAIYQNNIPVAKLLLKWKADPHGMTVHGRTCLIAASMNNQYDICKELLELGVDPDDAKKNSSGMKIGSTALMFACEKGYFDIVELLLSYKSDPNYLNDMRQNALMYACKTDNNTMQTIDALMNHGPINLSYHDIVGNNFLTILANKNDLNLLSYCLRAKNMYEPKCFNEKNFPLDTKYETIEFIKKLYTVIGLDNMLQCNNPIVNNDTKTIKL